MIRSLADFRREDEQDKLKNLIPGIRVVIQAQPNEASQKSNPSQDSDAVDVKVTLYIDGFIVEGQEFRGYASANSLEFMGQLNQGRVPREIFNRNQNKTVRLILQDRRKQKYMPLNLEAGDSEQAQALLATDLQGVAFVTAKAEDLIVDLTRSTTSVQLRLHNGQRKTLTMNLTTRIAEIYEYAMVGAPVDGSFELLHGYPLVALKDLTLTVQEAGVAGSALTQRIR